MIRDFLTLDKKIIEVDDSRLRHIQSNIFGELGEYYKEFITSNNYIEVFDGRKIHDINGKANTIILENDTMTPELIYNFAKHLANKQYGLVPNVFREFLGINKSSDKEGQIKYILDYIRDNRIKNICIDSLFRDLDQFRLFCELCLNRLYKVNLFINSHGTLLDTLNSHFLKNKEVSNVTLNCRIYDINFDTMLFKKIAYSCIEKKYHYVNTFFYNDKIEAND